MKIRGTVDGIHSLIEKEWQMANQEWQVARLLLSMQGFNSAYLQTPLILVAAELRWAALAEIDTRMSISGEHTKKADRELVDLTIKDHSDAKISLLC